MNLRGCQLIVMTLDGEWFWQHLVHRLTLKEVASSFYRIAKKFEELGTVSKKTYCSQNSTMKLTKPIQCTIIRLVLATLEYVYLWEIQSELHSVFNLEVSPTAVYRSLKVNNFSTKKDAACI